MNPAPTEPATPESHLSTKTVVIVLFIVLLCIGAVFAYMLKANKKTAAPVATSTTTTETSGLSSGTSDADIQKDLDGTKFDDLDADLDKAEKDIKSL